MRAMTPSHPISGTGRGKTAVLSRPCRAVMIPLRAALIPPMTYFMNQLDWPDPSMESRKSLSQVCSPVVWAKGSSRCPGS